MTRWTREAYRLCLVTDPGMSAGRSLANLVAEAVAGGVTMVQLRDKSGSSPAMLEEARALLALLRPLGIPLIVNDRLDIALAAGADGVHVGQDDLPTPVARQLVGPDLLLGLSITRAAELRRAEVEAADYLGVGPVFLQSTKADAAAPLGLDGLRTIARDATRPVLAIGGIGENNAAAVLRAGAAGIAVVSAIMGATDPRAAAQRLRAAASP